MRLQLRCHGDIDLSQPGMQVEEAADPQAAEKWLRSSSSWMSFSADSCWCRSWAEKGDEARQFLAGFFGTSGFAETPAARAGGPHFEVQSERPGAEFPVQSPFL